jgi:hypothetical protein
VCAANAYSVSAKKLFLKLNVQLLDDLDEEDTDEDY